MMSHEDEDESERISKALAQRFVSETKRVSKALSLADFAEAQRFSNDISQEDVAEGKKIARLLSQEDVPEGHRISKGHHENVTEGRTSKGHQEDVAEGQRIFSEALSQKFVAEAKRMSQALSQADLALPEQLPNELSHHDIAEGKLISKLLAQEDVPEDKRISSISKDPESGEPCLNCPYNRSSPYGTVGLAQSLNVPVSKADENQRVDGEDTEEDEEEEDSNRPPPPKPRPCALKAILDGMPKEWIEAGDASYRVVIRDSCQKQKINPLIVILSDMHQMKDRRESQMTRALFLKDFDATLQKINSDAQSKEPELDWLSPRHYTEILDAMASSLA